MHTTAAPEDVSVTPVAVLGDSQFGLFEAPASVPIISDTEAPAPAQPRTFTAALQPAEPDSGELVPELIDVWYEEYLARRALDELLESGALAAVFG